MFSVSVSFIRNIPGYVSDNTKIIKVFSAKAKSLEIHNIIPLLTAVSYGSSRKTPRSKNGHALNSPLYYILITKDANVKMSGDDHRKNFRSKENDALESNDGIKPF